MINQNFKMDFHTHTNYSPDSKTDMKKSILTAIEKNITDLAFTDHVDFDADIDSGIGDWDFDRNKYEEEIKFYQAKFEDQINLYHGLEIGVQPHLTDRNRDVVKMNQYDFVIASLHSVERRDLYHKKYFENHSDIDAIRIYFESYFESVKTFKDYSVLGHLDLYVRYKEELENVAFHKYSDHVEALLRMVIEDGKGIEINTGGYRYGLKYANPNRSFLELYKELKGEILTIGSDAHTPDFLGRKYDETVHLLKEIGFKYVSIFEQLKPKFIKL